MVAAVIDRKIPYKASMSERENAQLFWEFNSVRINMSEGRISLAKDAIPIVFFFFCFLTKPFTSLLKIEPRFLEVI